MKKLLLTTAALIAVAAPAQADNYNYESLSYLSGFYVGGFAGHTWNDVDTPVAGVDLDIDGGDYGVFFGYKADALLDETINRVGLGLNGAIEAHYAWSGADDEVGAVDFEKEGEWGISFRPGLSILDETMPWGINPYAILGYKHLELEGETAGVSEDESFDGFELGIGTEIITYGDFGVRLDYSHTWYGEESGFDPDSDDIRLGVAYHF